MSNAKDDVFPKRVGEIDALRGLAAFAVLLFHYTTRFDQLYEHQGVPLINADWGHFGVNLFFLISGYVIYMTLERTRTVADFAVSRFSRLYPAYWASLLTTFLLVSTMGLPGKEVSGVDAFLNLLMFHGLFRVPHVDSVYWTLEVELLFYLLALLAFRSGLDRKIHLAIFGLLMVRFTYFVAAKYFGIDLPWIVGHLLIIKYIPWFAIGIMVYRLVSGHGTTKTDVVVIFLSIFSLALTESFLLGIIGIGLSLLLYLAASNRMKFLRWGILIWLGEISYTLYLLHENIGWAFLLQFQRIGLNTNLSIVLVTLIVLTMASLMTRYVEQPAMHWIRGRYRKKFHRP